jgi:hypothetical protein
MTDPLWFRTGTRGDNAQRLVTALQGLGDTSDAKLVALDSLDSLRQPPDQQTMNLGTWLAALGAAAAVAYPYEHDQALAALPVLEKYLPQATDKGTALIGYLQALALRDPEAAYQRYMKELREPVNRGPVNLWVVRSMILGDPAVVAAHLGDFFPRGTSWSEQRRPGQPELTDLTVKGECVAALYRQSPQKGVDLALRMGLDTQYNYRLPGTPDPLALLAQAVKDKGLDSLPAGFPYQKFYATLAGELAKLDPAMGEALVKSLDETSDRMRALTNLCTALAPTNVEGARAAVRELQAVDAQYAYDRDAALGQCVQALAPYDEDVVGDLFQRLNWGNNLAGAYGTWWKAHRTTAEALLPKLKPGQQVCAISGLLQQGADLLTPVEQAAWGKQALDNPEFPKSAASRNLILALAKFSPELARQGGQLLPAPAASGQYGEIAQGRAGLLLSVAEAWETRKPASAGPEIAQVKALLAQMPTEGVYRGSPYEVRGRLALIYSGYDGPLAQQTAEGMLDELAKQTPLQEYLLTAPLTALARVDAKAADEYLHKFNLAGWGPTRDAVIQNVARHDPALAWQMIEEIGEYPARAAGVDNVCQALAKDAPPNIVQAFCDRRVAAQTGDKAHDTGNLLSCLLYAGRPELGGLLAEYLGQVPADRQCSVVLQIADGLIYAPPAFLDTVTGLAAKGQQTDNTEVNRALAAARAVQDWEGSQALLQALPAEPRGRALLAVYHAVQGGRGQG